MKKNSQKVAQIVFRLKNGGKHLDTPKNTLKHLPTPFALGKYLFQVTASKFETLSRTIYSAAGLNCQR